MRLRLIMGEAGSGKSERMREEYLRLSTDAARQRVILIVPEQITLLEQKKLIAAHPGRGLLGVWLTECCLSRGSGIWSSWMK